jgi:LAO/AO transport system kinase
VLAIDPTSPYSGGAILGDRVRMQGHALDDGVFIRSMATRGHLGGLALAAPEAVRVLDAVGFGVTLLETVGVGQVEVEVAGTADTTVVVVTPGWGDAIQANKAGLLEVADVFVVNKADRPGAAAAERDLANMLDLGGQTGGWRPPIVATVASSGDGVAALATAICEHRAHLVATHLLARRREVRLVDELGEILARRVERGIRDLQHGDAYEQVVSRLADRSVDPYTAADQLLGELGL